MTFMNSVEEIDILFDENYKYICGVVKEGKHDPISGMKITSGEIYLLGGKDNFSQVYIFGMLTEMMRAMKHVINEEFYVVVNDNGPSYLVFEPHDDQMVQLSHCVTIERAKNEKLRDGLDVSICIPQEILLEEIIDVVSNFYTNILKEKPCLREHWLMNALKNCKADVIMRYSESTDDVDFEV